MIKSTSGILAVIEQDRLIRARGVPYATARRFQKPIPVSTPTESRDATARGPAAPQDPSRLDKVNGLLVNGLDQDEDCLALSVVAPADARNLPVMVWFHGGAYVSGGGEAPKYDPESLARKGVVVVNVT